jgi:hypothetical protein
VRHAVEKVHASDDMRDASLFRPLYKEGRGSSRPMESVEEKYSERIDEVVP